MSQQQIYVETQRRDEINNVDRTLDKIKHVWTREKSKKNCRVIFKITEKCIFLLSNPVLHITKEKWKRFSKLC